MHSASDVHDGLYWIQWWCYGCLRQADASWLTAVAFSEDDLALAPVHHTAMRHRFDIVETTPPPPESALLQLGQLNAEQRRQVLALIAAVCRETEGEQPDALAIWCRRLAKALRPGLWLPSMLAFGQRREQDALVILRSRFPASCWSRLQLLYPRDWCDGAAETPAEALPAGRIASLCDAIIWKVAAG